MKIFSIQCRDLFYLIYLSETTNVKLRSIQLKPSTNSFRKLLEIVLALGNFMNRGNRGNASGFKLNSLSKLQDTKAVDQKSSLVHYLVQLCYDKVRSFVVYYKFYFRLINNSYFCTDTPVEKIQSFRSNNIHNLFLIKTRLNYYIFTNFSFLKLKLWKKI